LPTVTPEVHPIERDFLKLVKEERDYYATSDALFYDTVHQQFKKDFPEALAVDTPELQARSIVLRRFAPSPRVTKQDVEGNRRTLNRALGERIALAAQRPDGLWLFPSTPLGAGETLHQAAQRKLQEDNEGGGLEVYWPSHCPMAHVTDGHIHTFFLGCLYVFGRVKPPADAADYAWLRAPEVGTLEWAWPQRDVLRDML